ncbi:Uncharacterized protein dnl_09940 [Desulfonema limicola]|uniref:Uncharacterized protein n=1 Tax=Desulfonema limicola TaxID=45656 RepID=A0A975B4P5_9BACT|nr:Uncharacterized protein dnl_09940 [Desulfonema limicola]
MIYSLICYLLKILIISTGLSGINTAIFHKSLFLQTLNKIQTVKGGKLDY